MTKSWSSLKKKYQRDLGNYLARGDEVNLQRAYELGRVALNRGLGVFDMARLHQEALVSPAVFKKTKLDPVQQSRRVETFLLEALSPFEAAHRGFRKAWERLRQLNGDLEERNAELATTNKKLGEEIAERKRAEEALRETRDHYFRLFQQASSMEENLRLLSAKVLSAQEDERKRISRDLHDEIGQALTAVNVSVTMLKKQAGEDHDFQRKVDEAQHLLMQTMETVHRFARELRPSTFEHLGPQTAFRSYLTNFAERTGIKTSFRSKVDLNLLDAQRAIVLFRVAQESLTNVFKHAHATQVDVRFSPLPRALRMEIKDNGRSFQIKHRETADWKGRLGLLGMQERVRLINGEFTIDSVPGQGTTVRVQIPFDGPEASLAKPPSPAALEIRSQKTA